MKKTNKIKAWLPYPVADEEGFSLVEILVAITITSLLIGFASALWLTAQRYYLQWDQSFNLQNELHTLAQGITEDIYRADEILELQNDAVTIKIGSSVRKYYTQETDLLRDSLSLLDKKITLVEFKLFSPGSTLAPIPEEEEQETTDGMAKKTKFDTGKLKALGLALALTNGVDTLTARRVLYLRKPSTWKSIDKK